MEGQISSGLLTRAAEAVAEKGALQMLPQASNLFTGWSPSLPHPFGRHSQATPIPTPTNMEEVYKNFTLSTPRGNNNQYDMARPLVRPTTAPVAFARSQDTSKELGNWATTPIQQQARHEWMCKDSSNSLKLGPSSFIESESEVAPELAPVAFIDFLGVGAA